MLMCIKVFKCQINLFETLVSCHLTLFPHEPHPLLALSLPLLSSQALCCIDKKGILSWPNPTAEKVFFLRNSGPSSQNSSKTSLVGSIGPNDSTPEKVTEPTNPEPTTIVEVSP